MITNKDSYLAKLYFQVAVENERRLKSYTKILTEKNNQLTKSVFWEFLEIKEVK